MSRIRLRLLFSSDYARYLLDLLLLLHACHPIYPLQLSFISLVSYLKRITVTHKLHPPLLSHICLLMTIKHQKCKSRLHVLTLRARNSSKSTNSSGQAEYFCIVKDCEYSSSRAYDLERHMNIHSKQKKYPCEYKWCGRDDNNPFSREDHLKEHLRKVHMRDIPKREKGGRKKRES